MSVTAPTPITALGTPPSTSDPANFDTRADALFTQLPTTVTEINAIGTNVYNNALDAQTNAAAVATNASAVAVNTAAVASYASAPAWVSGTTYSLGAVVYGPTDRRLYRRIVAGAGTTDPSADTTNWTPIALNAPAQVVTASVTQAISGQCLALANTTTQGAATNLLLYSNQQDQSAWVKWHATVSANLTMSPTGDANADKLVEAADTAAHSTNQVVTAANNVPYTASVMVKAAGRTTFGLSMDKDGLLADYVKADFNLSSGAVSNVVNAGTASGASAFCTYVGNGWYLCSLSGTPASSAGTTVRVILHINGANNIYAGDGVSGIYVAQAQMETGTACTSRIDTGAATATRSSGVIAPQRIVLPASPGENAWVKPVVANGVATNVIDPNGQQFKGANGTVSGPIELDNIGFNGALQFIDGYWRFV